MSFKKLILYTLLAIIILLIIFIPTQKPNLITPNQKYNVILANTEELRIKGLSNKKYLEKNKIMLFVFDTPSIVGIWMKDMLFDIDIVYVDENWIVVDYFDNVSPSSYPKIYYPSVPTKYVIEMNSGARLKSGIDKGTQLYYK